MEEKKIEREVIDEWEKKLRLLTVKYEDDLRKKKDKNIERVNQKSFVFLSFSPSKTFFLGINIEIYKRKS